MIWIVSCYCKNSEKSRCDNHFQISPCTHYYFLFFIFWNVAKGKEDRNWSPPMFLMVINNDGVRLAPLIMANHNNCWSLKYKWKINILFSHISKFKILTEQFEWVVNELLVQLQGRTMINNSKIHFFWDDEGTHSNYPGVWTG